MENHAMRCALALAVCGVMAFNSLADEPPERLRAIWEKRSEWLSRTENYRRYEQELFDGTWAKPDPSRQFDRGIEKEEKLLERLQDEQKSKPNVRRRAELKKEIAAAQKRLTELRQKRDDLLAAKANEPEQQSPPDDLTAWPPIEFAVGEVGTLPLFPAGVISLGKREYLLRIAGRLDRGESAPGDRKFLERFGPQAAIKGRHNVKIIQVIGDGEALATIHDIGDAGTLDAPTFWLRGIDTSKLTDDSTIALNGVMEVTGTKKYDTAAGGARTVLVIEPFDVERLRPFLK